MIKQHNGAYVFLKNLDSMRWTDTGNPDAKESERSVIAHEVGAIEDCFRMIGAKVKETRENIEQLAVESISLHAGFLPQNEITFDFRHFLNCERPCSYAFVKPKFGKAVRPEVFAALTCLDYKLGDYHE